MIIDYLFIYLHLKQGTTNYIKHKVLYAEQPS